MHTLNQHFPTAASSKDQPRDDRQSRLRLHVWREDDPGRAAAEAFIRERFQDCYAADVQIFMPYLLGVTNDSDEISAVIGFRPAGSERLFLENYLDHSAEHALATASGCRVARTQIVEVGNLASADSASFRTLMIGLVTLLDRLPGASWIMCTVGERLFSLLRRTRFFPLLLQQADQQRLSPQQGDWGSYYQNKRHVVAGNINYGLRELKRKGIWRPEFAQQVDRILRDGLPG